MSIKKDSTTREVIAMVEYETTGKLNVLNAGKRGRYVIIEPDDEDI